jgi:hypothetical protein
MFCFATSGSATFRRVLRLSEDDQAEQPAPENGLASSLFSRLREELFMAISAYISLRDNTCA